MLDWIMDNKEWIFSGIGIFALTSIVATIKLFLKNNKGTVKILQKQKSGKHSINSQIAIQNNFRGEKNE